MFLVTSNLLICENFMCCHSKVVEFCISMETLGLSLSKGVWQTRIFFLSKLHQRRIETAYSFHNIAITHSHSQSPSQFVIEIQTAFICLLLRELSKLKSTPTFRFSECFTPHPLPALKNDRLLYKTANFQNCQEPASSAL